MPGKFGFVLHGLWPDGEGLKDPKWCKRVPAVSVPVMKQFFCATPSSGLMQYEWAKHGSCIESDAERYFAAANRHMRRSAFPTWRRFPDRNGRWHLHGCLCCRQSRLSADMVRVEVTPLGWLKELRLCLDKDYRPARCPRDISGEGADTRLRIWPAR
ncbi:MAG: hypothetical protein IPO97_08910 [Sphingomonadales bacterium]|nr:hypothetical protein [Sphingomonadales bacterium]